MAQSALMWSHSFYQHVIKGFKSILSASPVRKTAQSVLCREEEEMKQVPACTCNLWCLTAASSLT